MLLYYSDASPFARQVRVAARELEIEGLNEVEWDPFREETRELNPLGKIPFLVTAPDLVLYDSQVILHYLDSEWGNGTLLLPMAHHWGRETLASLLQGLTDSAVALRVESMRAEEGSDSAFWQARHRQTLTLGLSQVSRQLDLLPAEFSLLQIRLACLLEYLDYRHPELGWRRSHGALKLWLESVRHRPSLMATRPG